jgi:zinc protease
LKRAKAKIIGQRKIARQDLGSLAANTALDELYGLGFANYESEDAKIEAVTLADVQAAARKHLDPDSAVISLVAPDVSKSA